MDPQQIDNEQQGIDINNPNNVQPEEDVTTNREAFYARYRFYQPRVAIGEGTYSTVYLVWDTVDRTDVALKRFNIQEDDQAESFQRELGILGQIGRDNDHTVPFLGHHQNVQNLTRSYLVLGEMWRTLDVEVQRKREIREWYSIDKIRRLGLQIANGLAFLEGLNIIHADLKPANLMFTNVYCDHLRISDFGNAFVRDTEINHSIQTPEYRAMEVFLGLSPYTNVIDIWSFGCILVFMYCATHLFTAGTNNVDRDLVYDIVSTIGMPPRGMLLSSHMSVIYFDFERGQFKMRLDVLEESERSMNSLNIEQFLHVHRQQQRRQEYRWFVELINQMMDYNENRLNIAGIINHNFFTNPRAPRR